MPISVREFKAHLSRYLAEVRAGRTIEISSHRRVIARVTGVATDRDRGIARLRATGAASWSGGKPSGARIQLSPGGPTLAEIVGADRG